MGMTQDRLIPLSKMRRAIADRVSRSKSTIPHFYETVDVEMDALVSMREQILKAEPTLPKPSLTSFIVRSCALALREFPEVNSTYTEQGLVRHESVNVGCVVALDDGMLIPVVRDADRKTLHEVDAELSGLIDKARRHLLLPNAYSGGTFTVSNLGMTGIRSFAAIINPPESAMLAVGSIRREVRLGNSGPFEVSVVSLTLSADHRSIDGITAAKFLVRVKDLLEHPLDL